MSDKYIIRHVPGYDNYLVTADGEVISLKGKQPRQMKKREKYGGYLVVDLYNENKRITKSVHRLVAEAYLDNPLNKPLIDHKNGIRSDNRVENLRWATYQENRHWRN